MLDNYATNLAFSIGFSKFPYRIFYSSHQAQRLYIYNNLRSWELLMHGKHRKTRTQIGLARVYQLSAGMRYFLFPIPL